MYTVLSDTVHYRSLITGSTAQVIYSISSLSPHHHHHCPVVQTYIVRSWPFLASYLVRQNTPAAQLLTSTRTRIPSGRAATIVAAFRGSPADAAFVQESQSTRALVPVTFGLLVLLLVLRLLLPLPLRLFPSFFSSLSLSVFFQVHRLFICKTSFFFILFLFILVISFSFLL